MAGEGDRSAGSATQAAHKVIETARGQGQGCTLKVFKPKSLQDVAPSDAFHTATMGLESELTKHEIVEAILSPSGLQACVSRKLDDEDTRVQV